MLTTLPQWQALQDHYAEMKSVHLRDLFNNDPNRFTQYSIDTNDVLLDYSKNHITEKTLALLFDLANACDLKNKIEEMFRGEKINNSENRSALHIALRDVNFTFKNYYSEDIHADVTAALHKIEIFVNKIQSEKKITDIVNIGIGGSDLGPAMVTQALTPYHVPNLRFHFISSIDDFELQQVLQKINPANSLFVISSKSFSTRETLTNAQTIQNWFKQKNNNLNLKEHFFAVTSNAKNAIDFGIAAENIFPLWDWVGGRYSLWSAIGLPIALAIGMDHFRELLAGAHGMDQHFLNAPWSENMPIILGLLDIWYRNFFATNAHAILPYMDQLQRLPAYLQQAVMESNGKSATMNNEKVNYQTASIIFGERGTNGQHAFCQCLHQGTQIIPADFIIAAKTNLDSKHHAMLFANALSQSKALMEGNHELSPHKILTGNKPSNTILLPEITPKTLGNLLALYEHRIYVQSIIWNINAFDQWGVEYGKQLANDILPCLLETGCKANFDSSTNGLVGKYKK